jgi:hypothetical protein
MGKKSRQKAKVERGKQKKAAAGAAGGSGENMSDRRFYELKEAADPAKTGRMFAEYVPGHGADLDSPYAHFVASRCRDCVERVDGTVDLRVMLDREWSKLSDAEKAAFTSPPSFAAAARVRVTTDEASSSSTTATAAANSKRDATVSAAASTSAVVIDRAPPTPRPDDGTAYVKKLPKFLTRYNTACARICRLGF